MAENWWKWSKIDFKKISRGDFWYFAYLRRFWDFLTKIAKKWVNLVKKSRNLRKTSKNQKSPLQIFFKSIFDHSHQISATYLKKPRRRYKKHESMINCDLVKKRQKWVKKYLNLAKIKFPASNLRTNIKHKYVPNFGGLGWPQQDFWLFLTLF